MKKIDNISYGDRMREKVCSEPQRNVTFLYIAGPLDEFFDFETMFRIYITILEGGEMFERD